MGSAEVEADKLLLQFATYEDYLDSLVTPADIKYLHSSIVARKIAELGYRSSGEKLTREAFKRRLAAVVEMLWPARKPWDCYSDKVHVCSDPLIQDMARRELLNRTGKLSTILFLRERDKVTGVEKSGYIDFTERLAHENWGPVFEGRKKIRPKTKDLSYYNWRSGQNFCHTSQNYKFWMDPVDGLTFQHTADHLTVSVHPNLVTGPTTTRQRVYSDKYTHAILYDHFVRQKC